MGHFGHFNQDTLAAKEREKETLQEIGNFI